MDAPETVDGREEPPVHVPHLDNSMATGVGHGTHSTAGELAGAGNRDGVSVISGVTDPCSLPEGAGTVVAAAATTNTTAPAVVELPPLLVSQNAAEEVDSDAEGSAQVVMPPEATTAATEQDSQSAPAAMTTSSDAENTLATPLVVTTGPTIDIESTTSLPTLLPVASSNELADGSSTAPPSSLSATEPLQATEPLPALTTPASSAANNNAEQSANDDDGRLDAYIRSPEVQNAIVERSPGGRYVRFMEKLGSGASKDVYRAYDTQEGIEVAWNVVNLSGVPKSERNRIVNEVRLLERLHHHNIISFHGSWVNRERQEVNFVTEILSSGTLKSFIKKVQVIRWKIAKRWAVQILKGLEYLHSQDPPVIHRDLKCENIFINGTSGDLRIGDLGLSTVHRNGRVLSVLGTPEFMAPDMYEETSYDEKVDIYAFGMCMLEIFTKEIPYSECSNPAQIYKKVSNGDLPEVLSRLQSRHAREFVILCLGYKDANGAYVRPTATELLQHPFLVKRSNDDDEVVVDPPLRESVISEAGESTTSPSGTPSSKRQSEVSSSLGQQAVLASNVNAPAPSSRQPIPRRLSQDEDDADQFDEMPQSETNMRKVKVLMGRGQALEEDDSPASPLKDSDHISVEGSVASSIPGNSLPPPVSLPAPILVPPTAASQPPLTQQQQQLAPQPVVEQTEVQLQTQAPTQTWQHYLVAAAVIENENPHERPYPDDVLKLVVTLPVEGQTQNVQFDFHLVEDDPIKVAKEMVQELGIPPGAVLEISETISGLACAARMKVDKFHQIHGQRPSIISHQHQPQQIQQQQLPQHHQLHQPPPQQQQAAQGRELPPLQMGPGTVPDYAPVQQQQLAAMEQGVQMAEYSNANYQTHQQPAPQGVAGESGMHMHINQQPGHVQMQQSVIQHQAQPTHHPQGVSIEQGGHMRGQQPQVQISHSGTVQQQHISSHQQGISLEQGNQLTAQSAGQQSGHPNMPGQSSSLHSHPQHVNHQAVHVDPVGQMSMGQQAALVQLPGHPNTNRSQPHQMQHHVAHMDYNAPMAGGASLGQPSGHVSVSGQSATHPSHLPPPPQIGQASMQPQHQGGQSSSIHAQQQQLQPQGQAMSMQLQQQPQPNVVQSNAMQSQQQQIQSHGGDSHPQQVQQHHHLQSNPMQAQSQPQQQHVGQAHVMLPQQAESITTQSQSQHLLHQGSPSEQNAQMQAFTAGNQSGHVHEHGQVNIMPNQSQQHPGVVEHECLPHSTNQQQNFAAQPHQASTAYGESDPQQSMQLSSPLAGQVIPPPPAPSQLTIGQSNRGLPSSYGQSSDQVSQTPAPVEAHRRTPSMQQLPPMHPAGQTLPLVTSAQTVSASVVHAGRTRGQSSPDVNEAFLGIPSHVQRTSSTGTAMTASTAQQSNDGLDPEEMMELDRAVDSDLEDEMRKLEEDYQKNLQRMKKVFDNRMDNLQRSQIEREAQHQKFLERHQKERADYEKRLAQEAEQQNKRLEQLQREWEKKRESLSQYKRKHANAGKVVNAATNGMFASGDCDEPQPPQHQPAGGPNHTRSSSSVSAMSDKPPSPATVDHKQPQLDMNGSHNER